MSTRKLGTYATREEFLENEIRTLNYHIQSMIDTMKVMSMNRQDMSEELERMKQEIKSAVLAEREACAKVCEEMRIYVGRNNAVTQSSANECATAIRARGQA
jgi:cell division protein FtsB